MTMGKRERPRKRTTCKKGRAEIAGTIFCTALRVITYLIEIWDYLNR